MFSLVDIENEVNELAGQPEFVIRLIKEILDKPYLKQDDIRIRLTYSHLLRYYVSTKRKLHFLKNRFNDCYKYPGDWLPKKVEFVSQQLLEAKSKLREFAYDYLSEEQIVKLNKELGPTISRIQ